MIKGLGLPYMGSKRQLAPKIVDFILKENPDCKYIYDLFGGGAAVSFEFLQRQQIEKVFYNDLNTGVTALLCEIQDNGVTDKYYQWIDRETFNAHKNDDCWLGGLIKTCWSFGNNQKDYLFGKDIEEYKKNYHLLIVNNIDTRKEIEDYCQEYVFKKYGIRQDIKLTMPTSTNYKDRRLEIRKQITAFKIRCDLQQLQQLEQLERLQQLEQLERLQQLQQLERLERLQQLEQLQQLERLQQLDIQNKSYLDVKITTPINETVIYLDPPYKNTVKYQLVIDHDKLENYIKKSPYKIYMSGYQGFNDMIECMSINHRSTLSHTGSGNKTIEKLFSNG
jgi:site-specific DNA-adenine methylase